MVAPYGRQSKRLIAALQSIGLEIGGQVGARLARALALPTSSRTLLQRFHALPQPIFPPPRVLGVDEWAWRKEHRYGTLRVDLERHRPIDLLPERQTESFAAWLQQHLGVEIVARDRGGTYAEAVATVLPQAIQVAHRFHLLKNLGWTRPHER